jgi:hypothetical protein
MLLPSASADSRAPVSLCLKILLLAVLFCFVQGRTCFAAYSYTIVQNQQLAFGTLQVPSSGSQTWTVSTAGSTSGTGTLLYGFPANGDYTIKCVGISCSNFPAPVPTINASLTAGCSGLSSLGSWQGNYNNGAQTGALPLNNVAFPGAGGLDFKLGATATYTSAVSSANCSNTFNISVSDNHGVNVNFSFNSSLAFDAALALTKNSDINFGTVSALNASTYRISTAGAVTTVSGTGSYLTGTTAAGNIQIAGSATDGITISAGGYTADNGVTPSNAQCSYNGGAAAACAMTGAAPGSGSTLLVGVDVATDGTQAGGTTAAPTFTITVAYQ